MADPIRTKMIWVSAAVIIWGMGEGIGWGGEAATYDLRPQRQSDQTDRVEAALEVEGVLVVSEDPKHPRPKVKVTAKNVYDERLLEVQADTGCPARTVRYYHTAEATIQVEEENIKPQLRPECRWIVAEAQRARVTLFSPKSPLTREELDLIDLVGNTVLLDRLLPAEPVAQNASWRLSKETLALLLGLDEVSQSDVQCTLTTVSERSMLVEMAGSVQGSNGGGQSGMVLKAKYRVDRKSGRINWFGLAMAERRTPGTVLRGVDVVVKLSVQITPNIESPSLRAETLGDIPLKAREDLLLLVYRPPGRGWEIRHPRNWHINREENQTAVLGLFEQEAWVAQGTITLMPPLPQGEDVSLEQFQKDIQQALGKNFGEFVQAGQSPGPENQRIYRVIVHGNITSQVQNKPIEVAMRWHYYRLADAEGRQAVCAFSMEQDQHQRLGEADKAIVESFRFLDLPAGSDHPVQASQAGVPNAGKGPSHKD